MAKLYFKYGAMGSSKTANALITKFNYEERGMRVWLIKPSIDDRDGADIIRSRIGLEQRAQIITPEMDIFEEFKSHVSTHAVIADECQFFTSAQIDQLRRIVDELDIPVVYAGLAFRDVYTKSSEVELYNSDMSHPSYKGSYLAAATLFAHIFDTDPAIIPLSEEVTVSAATADILNDAAWRAVREPHDIPEEYKTTSSGIE